MIVDFINMPLFSVIIPIYNTAVYLDDCLQSVVCQLPEQEVEIICINDGSTDDSVAVLQPYLARYPNIRLINQPNAGLSAARNAGLQHANGDFVLFLDSDDMLLPNALKTLQQTIRLHPSADIVAFGSILWYDTENKKTPNAAFNHTEAIMYRSGMDYLAYFVNTRGWGPSAACFYAYRRTLITQNKLLFPVGMLHEDELFVPQTLSLAGEVHTISESIYLYRMRKSSIVHTETEKHSRDKLSIAHQLECFFQEHNNMNTATRRIVYSLLLNAMLGLKRLHIRLPLAEWRHVFQLADSSKTRLKLIKKICTI